MVNLYGDVLFAINYHLIFLQTLLVLFHKLKTFIEIKVFLYASNNIFYTPSKEREKG